MRGLTREEVFAADVLLRLEAGSVDGFGELLAARDVASALVRDGRAQRVKCPFCGSHDIERLTPDGRLALRLTRAAQGGELP